VDKEEAMTKVEQMDLAEKIANLSETDMAYVKECVEQAISDEGKENEERGETNEQ
jgi:hypothetical protein